LTRGTGVPPVETHGQDARDTTAATANLDEDHLTSPGVAMGTVAYMSPEQARGEDVDARTDLFSLGAVLYEMATGQRDLAGERTAVIFHQILAENPPPVTQLNPSAPPSAPSFSSRDWDFWRPPHPSPKRIHPHGSNDLLRCLPARPAVISTVASVMIRTNSSPP